MTGFLLVLGAWLIAGHAFFGARWIPDGMGDIIAVYVRLWRQAIHRYHVWTKQ